MTQNIAAAVLSYPFLLNGQWISDGQPSEVHSPFDQSVVGRDAGHLNIRLAGQPLPQQRPDHHRIIDHQHPYAIHRPCDVSPSSCSLSTMISRVNGFITYSSAPAPSARDISPISVAVVTIITLTWFQRAFARSWRSISKPSISGMFQSSNTRSGALATSSACKPSLPLRASETSNPAAFRI